VDPFPALADPVRRALLARLAADGPTRVVDLHRDHEVSRPAVSRHLRVLHEAGLVAAQDRGRERWYSLLPDGLLPVHEWLAALGTRPPVTPEALDALDLEVRRTVREGGTRPATTRPTHEETA
jgi:DNA-binding transcriptional ArsR family regulator